MARAVRDGGVLTGVAVLALRKFGSVPWAGSFRTVQVIAPSARREPEVVRVDGLPTAPVSRAVADALPVLGDDTCRALLTEAVRERHVTRSALVRELRAGGHYGRAVVRRTMRALLDGEPRWFPPEAGLRQATALPGPVAWDAELWVDDEVVGVADAYWPAQGVAVEAAGQAVTARHADVLKALGLSVVRLEPRCAHAAHTLNATLAGGPYATAVVRRAVRAVPC